MANTETTTATPAAQQAADEHAKKTPAKRIPLRITDTTLRDAHQSLWATRMRTDDMIKILDVIDSVGYYSLEVWGGATFDVCLRFLRENPWDRLRKIKSIAKKTPLQMLLRGQNVVGYKNYPDDLLEHFVALSCENGMDIFRVFDALNDTRNLEQAVKFVKKYGGHAQGTLSYTTSPVHTVKEFVRCAKEQVAIGIDSLCIKDMAGILTPIAAEKLVSALFKEIKVPIQLHSHATSGMAASAYVEGVRAGAGAIDCAISPLAGFQSQPPVETMLAIFDEMPYHATLDKEALRRVCKYFLGLKRQRMMSFHEPENIIDPEILMHHIPGGMISNLRSQLEKQNALNRIEEVFKELPKVRAELGYPPLVTPTSQIIGIQAVMNVLAGERYKMVPQEIKDYVRGLYGRAPSKIDEKVKQKILGDEKVLTCRPADLLEPMLPNATKQVDPALIHNEEDIITYCLFPEPALEYFKWRATPLENRPAPPADLELKKGVREVTGGEVPPNTSPAQPLMSASDYQAMQDLAQKLHDLNFSEFKITRGDVSVTLVGQPGAATAAAQKPAAPKPQGDAAKKPAAPATAPKADAKKDDSKPQQAAAPAAAAGGPTINAPLTGTFYTSPGAGKPPFVKVGDIVEAGKPVCIVEAMKLFNEVKAPEKCKIVELILQHGAAVQKDQPMVRYEKA